MSSTEPANTFPEPAQPAPVSGPSPSPVTSPDKSMIDVPLGTLIFRAGLLGEEQLEDALQEGMRTGKRLGEVLLERGWLNEVDLGQMLAGQKGLPFVDVSLDDVEHDALAALSEDDARRQVALPLFYEDGELVVAVGDPSNEVVLEGLRRELGSDFQLVVAPHSQLLQVIDAAYSRPVPAPAPELAPVPASRGEGVLFPDLVPPAKDEAPAQPERAPETEAEADAEPDLGFAPAVEPELEADDDDGEEKPFAGSTPTLLSRMLFPSVRHAAQEADVATVEEAEEPEPAAEAPPAPTEDPAPVAVEPEPAEDFAELEVPAVPEMPVPSFEQPAAEVAPAQAEETPQPAAEPQVEQPVEEPQAEQPVEEPRAEQPAEEPQAEQPVEEPQAEQPVEEPQAEQPVEEPQAEQPAEEPQAEQPAQQPEPEQPAEELQAEQPAEEEPQVEHPQAEQPQAEQPQAEEPQPATHFVVVRLRDGETLRIGEHADAAGASAQAAEAVRQISAAAGNGTWPLFAGRYLSPDTIVSVDLVDETPDA
jgi:hypothetical protein